MLRLDNDISSACASVTGASLPYFGLLARSNTLEASAASQLVEAGKELHAGESIGYVIASQRSTSRKFRTTPQELISDDTHYDAGRYVELLEAACKTVLGPFA